MIKEKQVTIKVFDEKIFKPGTKIICKWRAIVDDEVELFDEIIDGKIIRFNNERLIVEGIHEYHGVDVVRRIDIEDVIGGFWVLELV